MNIKNLFKTVLGINKRKIINILKSKGRVAAIKLYREIYKCNLLDAVYKINKWFGLTGNDQWCNFYDTYGNKINPYNNLKNEDIKKVDKTISDLGMNSFFSMSFDEFVKQNQSNK